MFERDRKRSTSQIMIAVVVFASLACATAKAGDIVVQGTLLCRNPKTPQHEQPVDGLGFVVVPLEYAHVSDVVDESGLFRMTLPRRTIDHLLVFSVLSGFREVGRFSSYLEYGAMRKVNGRLLVPIGSFALDGACDEYDVDGGMALSARDVIRDRVAQGLSWNVNEEPDSTVTRTGVASRNIATPIGTLLVGLVTVLSGGGQSASPHPDSTFTVTVPVTGIARAPNSIAEWPYAIRTSGSSSLGRTLTSLRAPEELALVNPSALLLGAPSGLAFGYGTSDVLRASVWTQIGEPDQPALVPRSFSAAILSHRHDVTLQYDLGLEGIRDVEAPISEWEMSIGAAWSVGEDVAVAAGWRYASQSLVFADSVAITTVVPEDGPSRQAATLKGPEHRERTHDVDLSWTWSLAPRHRLAMAGQSLLRTHTLGPDGRRRSARRFALGYAFVPGPLHVGCETWYAFDRWSTAAGMSMRLSDRVVFDVGGDTRFDSLQAGLDIHWGRVSLLVRLYENEFDKGGVNMSTRLQF